MIFLCSLSVSIPKEWQSYQLPVDITCVLRIKYVYTLFLFCMLGNCVKTDKTQNLTNCSQFFISLHFFYSFGPSIIWMWSTREELWERKTQTIKVSTNVIFNWNIILSIIDRFIGYCQWKLNFNWFLFYFFRASAGVWLEGWCRQRRRDLLLHSLSDKPSHWLTCNVLSSHSVTNQLSASTFWAAIPQLSVGKTQKLLLVKWSLTTANILAGFLWGELELNSSWNRAPKNLLSREITLKFSAWYKILFSKSKYLICPWTI